MREMHVPELPSCLSGIQKAEHFPVQRHRWNTNEEIASILISLDRHGEWLSKEVQIRPKSGTMILYNRKRMRYRRDGYCWKKRKDGKTTREDHMKLKVQGTECIYGCYVHSAILPTFHRRCYWLLMNSDIVLVHYLNVPFSDDNKLISPSLNLFTDSTKKEWNRDDLIAELKPMFYNCNNPDLNNELELANGETIGAMVQHILSKHRTSVQAFEKLNLDVGTVVNSKSTSREPILPKWPKLSLSTVRDSNCKSEDLNYICENSKINAPINSDIFETPPERDYSQTCGKSLNKSVIITQYQPRTTVSTSSTFANPLSIPAANVKLLHLASNPNSPAKTVTTSASQSSASSISTVPITSQTTSNSTSVILSLSHLQNCGSFLILNSGTSFASSQTQESQNASSQHINLLCNISENCNPLAEKSFKDGDKSEKTQERQASLDSVSSSFSSNSQNCEISQGNPEDISKDNVSCDNNPHLNSEQTSQAGKNYLLRIVPMPYNEPSSISVAPNVLKVVPETHHEAINDSLTASIAAKEVENQESLISTFDHTSTLNSKGFSQHSEKFDQYRDDAILQLSSNLSSSANSTALLPHHSTECEMDPIDLNPMDFIDNDIPSTSDEELFNLESFGMLTDGLANLDYFNNSVYCNRTIPSQTSPSPMSNPNHEQYSQGFLEQNLNNHSNFASNKCHQYKNKKYTFSKLDSMGYSSQSSSLSGSTSSTPSSTFACSNIANSDYQSTQKNVVEISPEWSYTSGGSKILLVGPWSIYSKYRVFFGHISVPADLIKESVLRCYAPPHKAGSVPLRVALSSQIISNSIHFEYREEFSPKLSSQGSSYFSIDANILKFSILERLDLLESHLSLFNNKSLSSEEILMHKNISRFEDKLCSIIHRLKSSQWLPSDESSLTSHLLRESCSLMDMSLIHLAAALGYPNVIQSLIAWKLKSPSMFLNLEVDAFSCDKNECTPLMWSIACGHEEAATILFDWNQAAINLCDNRGYSPLQIARQNGFTKLADKFEQILKQSTFQVSSPLKPQSTVFINKKQYSSTVDFEETCNSTPSSTATKRSSSCLQIRSLSPLSSPTTDIGIISHHISSQEESLSLNGNLLPDCDSQHQFQTENSLRCCFTNSCDGFKCDQSSCEENNICLDEGSETCRVLTIAEHIIAAMPDRIKTAPKGSLSDQINHINSQAYGNDGSERISGMVVSQDGDCDINDRDFNSIICDSGHRQDQLSSLGVSCLGGQNDVDIDSPFIDPVFCFEYTDKNYRPCDLASPISSPGSSCLQSPSSFRNFESPSPPSQQSIDFCEFFQTPCKVMVKEFSELTLSDREQRELYEAARVIQKAYRTYKGRKRQELEKERQAAILIQDYYRRYKEYVKNKYLKQRTKAAQVIQARFRDYRDHKRFRLAEKLDSHQEKPHFSDALLEKNENSNGNSGVSSDGTSKGTIVTINSMKMEKKRPSLRESSLLIDSKLSVQRRKHKAARTIQRFLRLSRDKLQQERAEKKQASESGTYHRAKE